jgi:predicted dienelactone hydrolase
VAFFVTLSIITMVACQSPEEGKETAAPTSESASPTETGSPTAPFTPEHAYDALGPYTVGTYDTTAPGSTGETLRLQVWYPSTEVGEAALYEELWPGTAYTGVAGACEAPRPVIVFSHGNAGVRWQSAEIVEHIVSHGYVVVAPDHPNNSVFDHNFTVFDETLVRRPVDVADAFDALVALSEDPTDATSGCVDPSAGYAVAGHSFGGYTAYAAGGATVNNPDGGGALDLSDPRVWAVLTWAPWDAFGAITTGTSKIEVPVMCLSGLLDATTPWGQVTALYDALEVEPRYLGQLPTAGHYSFSPVACATGGVGDGCGDGFIDLERVTVLVATSSLAFLESIVTDPGAIEHRAEASDDLVWQD